VIISGPTRIIVLALDCPPTVIIAVYAIAGMGSGLFNPALRSTMADVAPAGVRGRVYALVDALSWIGLPTAGLLATTTVTVLTLPGTLWTFGIAYLAAVLYPARRITRPAAHPVAAAALTPRRRPEPGATSRDITPQWTT
jgi:MFS family permease